MRLDNFFSVSSTEVTLQTLHVPPHRRKIHSSKFLKNYFIMQNLGSYVIIIYSYLDHHLMCLSLYTLTLRLQNLTLVYFYTYLIHCTTLHKNNRTQVLSVTEEELTTRPDKFFGHIMIFIILIILLLI